MMRREKAGLPAFFDGVRDTHPQRYPTCPRATDGAPANPARYFVLMKWTGFILREAKGWATRQYKS